MRSEAPCPSRNIERCVVKTRIEEIWKIIKIGNFSEIAPNLVFGSEWVQGEPGKVGSNVLISLTNRDKFYWNILGLSERNKSITYTVINAKPAIPVTSMEGAIQLTEVTDDGSTLFTWSTEYSNDIDQNFYAEVKSFKLSLFAAMKQCFNHTEACKNDDTLYDEATMQRIEYRKSISTVRQDQPSKETADKASRRLSVRKPSRSRIVINVG